MIKFPGNYRWSNQGAVAPHVSTTEGMDEDKQEADNSLRAFLKQSGIHTERRGTGKGEQTSPDPKEEGVPEAPKRGERKSKLSFQQPYLPFLETQTSKMTYLHVSRGPRLVVFWSKMANFGCPL